MILGLSHGVADSGIAGSSRQLSHSTNCAHSRRMVMGSVRVQDGERGKEEMGMELASREHGRAFGGATSEPYILRGHGTALLVPR